MSGRKQAKECQFETKPIFIARFGKCVFTFLSEDFFKKENIKIGFLKQKKKESSFF